MTNGCGSWPRLRGDGTQTVGVPSAQARACALRSCSERSRATFLPLRQARAPDSLRSGRVLPCRAEASAKAAPERSARALRTFGAPADVAVLSAAVGAPRAFPALSLSKGFARGVRTAERAMTGQAAQKAPTTFSRWNCPPRSKAAIAGAARRFALTVWCDPSTSSFRFVNFLYGLSIAAQSFMDFPSTWNGPDLGALPDGSAESG